MRFSDSYMRHDFFKIVLRVILKKKEKRKRTLHTLFLNSIYFFWFPLVIYPDLEPTLAGNGGIKRGVGSFFFILFFFSLGGNPLERYSRPIPGNCAGGDIKNEWYMVSNLFVLFKINTETM